MSEQLELGGDVCRTCLSTCRQMVPLKSQLPIASSTAERKTHHECLRLCIQQEVPLSSDNVCSDGGVVGGFNYPAHICLRCSKALQVAYHFIALACDSEHTLQGQATTQGQQLKIGNDGVELQQNDCLQLAGGGKQQKLVVGNKPKPKVAPLPQSTEFISQFGKFVHNYVVLKSNSSTNGNTENNLIVQRQNSRAQQEEIPSLTVTAHYDEHIYDRTEDPICVNSGISAYEQNFVGNVNDFEDGRKYFDSLDGVNDFNFDIKKDVLSKMENQHAICPVANVAERCDFTEIASSIIEEFKENISSGIVTRDLTLVRNKITTLQETKELQKALEAKEAEVQNNELVCVQCNKRFTDMHVFLRHRNRHKGITPFRCNLCNYFTCYSESLRKHYNREHDIEADNEMLNVRIEPNVTPNEKPYNEVTLKCLECNFRTNREKEMQMHIRTYHLIYGEESVYFTKVFNCPDCHRTFKEQKSMRTHFTLMHGTSMGIRKISTEIFVCEHCTKQFNFKASLVSHQRACRLREGVGCNFCNKKFATVRQFERHLRAEHNVETIHECEVCCKVFNNADSLSMHRKRHSERHYQCELCPRNYANSSELKAHVQRMHSTEAKALCLVCGASFTNLGSLREHENKEHFKKYFKCQYCDYQCTSRCNLRIHQYTHTGKPYKCGICGKEYSLRAILRRHSKNAHGINITEEELGAMFRNKFGYPSRYDAFSKANNSLEITEVNEEDIELELKEYGLKFDDIVNDLFANDLSLSQ